jgi:hypothetical protein
MGRLAKTEADFAFLTQATTNCKSAVKSALARGYTVETVSREEGRRSLGEINEECQHLEEEVRDYLAQAKHDAEVLAERHNERAAEDRALVEAGLTGDRLSVARGGDYRGASNSRMTPQQLRKAKYAFVLLGSDADGWVLRRLEFEGNQIVDQRDQGFVVMPGPAAYH